VATPPWSSRFRNIRWICRLQEEHAAAVHAVLLSGRHAKLEFRFFVRTQLRGEIDAKFSRADPATPWGREQRESTREDVRLRGQLEADGRSEFPCGSAVV